MPSHQRDQAARGGGDVDVVFLFSCFDNIVRRHIGKKKKDSKQPSFFINIKTSSFLTTQVYF